MADNNDSRRRNAGDDGYLKSIPHERQGDRPDYANQPLPPKKLPASLQADLDDDEKYWSIITEGKYVFNPFSYRHLQYYTKSIASHLSVRSYHPP